MLTQKLLSLALTGTEWVIYLLALLSIFSIAVIFERLFVLRAKKGDMENLQQEIGSAFKKKDDAAIERILKNDRSSAASVAGAVMRNMKNTCLDFEECLAIALSEEKIKLESRITILGTLGSNAPFIGLFGTVLGIINAFHSLSVNTKGGPAVVMAGISEALVATALGLFVAIPAVIAYNYFMRNIKKIIVVSENFTRFVVSSYMAGSKERG